MQDLSHHTVKNKFDLDCGAAHLSVSLVLMTKLRGHRVPF